MDYVPTNQFLALACGHGIVPDTGYTDPRYLIYERDPDIWRYWDSPEVPGRLVLLISELMAAMDPWTHCYLWPRGRWGHAAGREGAPADQATYCWMLRAAGIRPEFDGVVRYAAVEMTTLVAALFAVRSFGFTVADDVFVMPDHGRQLLMVGHHEEIKVSFTAADDVERFVDQMTRRRFPLPDET